MSMQLKDYENFPILITNTDEVGVNTKVEDKSGNIIPKISSMNIRIDPNELITAEIEIMKPIIGLQAVGIFKTYGLEDYNSLQLKFLRDEIDKILRGNGNE